ncbi:hypothetical protein NPIL_398211 [Nephila pilipes]|uniref:Uncharacterized protein n=1 Tax=Nephila pilipes TaxID=299642 RepID=A0A8X6TWW7_NEPPI|nr:hypothetical protein NPIL_398211 [Nephila pilipes]
MRISIAARHKSSPLEVFMTWSSFERGRRRGSRRKSAAAWRTAGKQCQRYGRRGKAATAAVAASYAFLKAYGGFGKCRMSKVFAYKTKQ